MTDFDGVERQTGDEPVASILWLHGLGADADDFVPIVPELVRRDWPPLRFVFPNAPMRAITINGGMRMRGWYDLFGLDASSPEDDAGIRASIAATERLIDREVVRGVGRSRVFIAGFSQGGAVAMATLIHQREPLAGAILLSTWLPRVALAAVDADEANHDTPVFMAHGALDPLLPQALGERSAAALRERGHPLEWHSYPIAHAVGGTEIADIGDWLDRRLQVLSTC